MRSGGAAAEPDEPVSRSERKERPTADAHRLVVAEVLVERVLLRAVDTELGYARGPMPDDERAWKFVQDVVIAQLVRHVDLGDPDVVVPPEVRDLVMRAADRREEVRHHHARLVSALRATPVRDEDAHVRRKVRHHRVRVAAVDRSQEGLDRRVAQETITSLIISGPRYWRIRRRGRARAPGCEAARQPLGLWAGAGIEQCVDRPAQVYVLASAFARVEGHRVWLDAARAVVAREGGAVAARLARRLRNDVAPGVVERKAAARRAANLEAALVDEPVVEPAEPEEIVQVRLAAVGQCST